MFGKTAGPLKEISGKRLQIISCEFPFSPPICHDSRCKNPHKIVDAQICRIIRAQKLGMLLRHLQHLDLAGYATFEILMCLRNRYRTQKSLKFHTHRSFTAVPEVLCIPSRHLDTSHRNFPCTTDQPLHALRLQMTAIGDICPQDRRLSGGADRAYSRHPSR